MKENVLTWLSGACAVCFGLLLSTASAQDAPDRDRILPRNARTTNAAKLDAKTTGHSIRASQFIGMNIQNSRQENVGEVHDVVLDVGSGEIQYVAVTYGGLLGVGDKLFAVPFEAIQCRQDANDPGEYVLVLDVTQQQLEGAEGFDQDHWPNFADPEFTDKLYQRYRVERRRPLRDRVGTRNRERVLDRARDADVDVNVDRSGIDVDVDDDN